MENFDKDVVLKEKQQCEKETKNTDVYNALSLENKKLGKLYVDQNYNPYEKDFVLDEDRIIESLGKKFEADLIEYPSFLSADKNTIIKCFENAVKNNDILSKRMNEYLINANLGKVKFEKSKMPSLKNKIINIKNKNELLKLAIKKMNSKDANAEELFEEISVLDVELERIIKNNYAEKANFDLMMMSILASLRESKQIMQKPKTAKILIEKPIEKAKKSSEEQDTEDLKNINELLQKYGTVSTRLSQAEIKKKLEDEMFYEEQEERELDELYGSGDDNFDKQDDVDEKDNDGEQDFVFNRD